MTKSYYIDYDQQTGEILSAGTQCEGIMFNDCPDDMLEFLGLKKYFVEGELVKLNPDYQDNPLTQEQIEFLLTRDGLVSINYWSASQWEAQYAVDFGE